MSVENAKPGEIFVDPNGKRWFCYGICHEPMVFMEEETPGEDAIPVRKFGGVTGAMWRGFERANE